MKGLRLFTICGLLLIGSFVYVGANEFSLNKDDFKDPLLSELVFEKYDFNHDDNLSKEECDEVKELIISASFIQDLKGIEHFVNLEKLVLNTCAVESLDISENIALKALYIQNTPVNKLDLTANRNLEVLLIKNADLDILDIHLNTKLKRLSLEDLSLYSLNVDNLTSLEEVTLVDLKIEDEVIWPSLIHLKNLKVNNADMKIPDFGISKELESLTVNNDEEGEVKINSSKLSYVDLRHNNYQLINLENSSSLRCVYVDDNPLIALDLGNEPRVLSFDENGGTLEITAWGKAIYLTPPFNGKNWPKKLEGLNLNYHEGVVEAIKLGENIFNYRYQVTDDRYLKASLIINVEKGRVRNIVINEELNKEYDGQSVSANPDFTIAYGDMGVVKDIYYERYLDDRWILMESLPKDVGEYRINISLAEDAFYDEYTYWENFAITKAPSKISVNVEMPEGNKKPSFSYDSANMEGEVIYEIEKMIEGNFKTYEDEEYDNGIYRIRAKITETENYMAETSSWLPFVLADEVEELMLEAELDKTYDKKLVEFIIPEFAKAYKNKLIVYYDEEGRALKEAPKNGGNYRVALMIYDGNDKAYIYSTDFHIAQAGNYFLNDFKVYDCIDSGHIDFIAPLAKWGKAELWYAKENNGSYTKDKPREAGQYYVKAVVEESADCVGIETLPKSFKILE